MRRIQRPRYGFYLDHLTDAYSTVAIGLGLGLSPYMLLSVGLAIVIGYLVLSINVYLETHVMGEFRYGYGVVGPTEARLVLVALNTLALTVGAAAVPPAGRGRRVFDMVGLVMAVSCCSCCCAARRATCGDPGAAGAGEHGEGLMLSPAGGAGVRA